MIKLIMFFVILEGFQTDSAKSSLGFLDDLSEGHLLFFNFWDFFGSIEHFFQKTVSLDPTDGAGSPKKGSDIPLIEKM